MHKKINICVISTSYRCPHIKFYNSGTTNTKMVKITRELTRSISTIDKNYMRFGRNKLKLSSKCGKILDLSLMKNLQN